MYKAKTGLNASNTKDNASVESSWKKIIKMVIVVAIVSFAQMKFDTSSQVSAGRNLQAV